MNEDHGGMTMGKGKRGVYKSKIKKLGECETGLHKVRNIEGIKLFKD